jgi:protein-tyrosine-phosphatase
MNQKVILVVCGGNIHRSPIAEFCLNRSLKEKGLDKRMIVLSRGVQGAFGIKSPIRKKLKDYPLEWSLSIPILEELGIDISNHSVIPIEDRIMEEASLVLVMDSKILNTMANWFPLHRHKLHLFRELEGAKMDVPDCFGSSESKMYECVITMIENVSKGSLETLLQLVGIQPQ